MGRMGWSRVGYVGVGRLGFLVATQRKIKNENR